MSEWELLTIMGLKISPPVMSLIENWGGNINKHGEYEKICFTLKGVVKLKLKGVCSKRQEILEVDSKQW